MTKPMSADKVIKKYTVTLTDGMEIRSKGAVIRAMKEFAGQWVEYTKQRCAKEANLCLRKYKHNGEYTESKYGQEVSADKNGEYWGIYEQSILSAVNPNEIV